MPAADQALRVTWLGLRGLPGVQGGVETHAEQLCPRLQALGCELTVLARAPYQAVLPASRWQGVRLRRLWAPRHKHLEAVAHTFLGVLHAGLVKRPDVLHLQAIGPALWTPLARLLGLRVVVTHHGADYERQKWGPLARWVLKLGEASAARWAHELVVISHAIQRDVQARHQRQGCWIPNGLTLPSAPADPSVLADFGLQPRRYVLLVSRLVPEKRHLDLIQAFANAQAQGRLQGWRLALVGAADHADAIAGLDGQRDAIENDVGPETVGDVGRGDQRHGPGGYPPPASTRRRPRGTTTEQSATGPGPSIRSPAGANHSA